MTDPPPVDTWAADGDPFWILFFVLEVIDEYCNSYHTWKNLAAASCRSCKVYLDHQEVREMIPDVASQPPQAIFVDDLVSELAKNL